MDNNTLQQQKEISIADTLTAKIDDFMLQKQQRGEKPVFKSASLAVRNGNPHMNHHCEKCGCNSHHVGECPWSTNEFTRFKGNEF